jgi:hypothetical protein
MLSMTQFLAPPAEQLAAVGGVVAVALGGSRARGTHRPDSGYDLGLYHRGPCLFRASGVLCQALHAHAGAWLLNEKAMVASAGRLECAPGASAKKHSIY